MKCSSLLLYSTLNCTLHNRAVVSTGSRGSIEPVDFWKRHNGTGEIAKIIRIEFVNFYDIIAIEPVISKT